MRYFFPFVFVVCASALAHAGGEELYVSTLGNDASNDCRTSATPCRSIGHSLAQATEGAIINVAAGTYEEIVILADPPSVEIRGGFDETFSNASGETIWQSKGTRPLTVAVSGATSFLSIHDFTFSKSSHKVQDLDSLSDYGGAILLHADDAATAGLVLTGVTMHGNKAAVGGAVAAMAEGGSSLSVSLLQSRFTKNKADACGAVYIDSIDAPPAEVTVLSSTFEKNKAALDGGAMCIIVTDATGTQSQQILNGNVFTKNKGGTGGALAALVVEGGRLDMRVSNSVFLKNKAQVGGGIASIAFSGEGDVPAAVNLTTIHTTFNANKASFFGGGTMVVSALNPDDGSTASTVVHDSTNDILFGNKGEDAYVFEDPGTSATWNRQYGIFGAVGSLGGTIVDGDGVVTSDPLFVKNGKDIHLQSGSPAIDAGTCVMNVSLYDVENDSRPNGSTCDIGAIEF